MSTLSPSDYIGRIERDLRSNILPFWIKQVATGQSGGFLGSLTNDLEADLSAERGALLTSRILWTYAAAYREYRDPSYLDMAQRAYGDLINHFHDSHHGGFWWSVAADGTVLRDRKQVYGQAFAIYALAEYHAATGLREPLYQAIAVYRLIEAHARDRTHGGYFEAFGREWQPIEDMRLSAVDQNDPKSQNTHLHVMEAYANLLRVWPDPELRGNLRDLVDVMLTRVLDPASLTRPEQEGVSFKVEQNKDGRGLLVTATFSPDFTKRLAAEETIPLAFGVPGASSAQLTCKAKRDRR